MRRRIGVVLTAAATLPLALAACQSSTGGSDAAGGTGGSSGGSSGGTVAAGPSSNAAAPSANGGDGGHVNTSDDFDGCKIWFGMSQGGSSTYLVSASSEGIGGQVTWKCSKMAVGVDRLRISAHLEHAYVLGGPYTDEPEATKSGGGTNGNGSLFPLTSYCTTDWWRVRVTIGFDETGGGPMTRPALVSESRKVTSEDCNRG